MSKKLLTASMVAYIGTKSVLATPMTRGEYNEYQGWQIPENEDPSDPGYLIEYKDGGKADHYPASRCHLFLTEGKIQFLTDCHHELAGLTVDMVPIDV
ncbi:hypothetical protein Q5M68_18790 [Acinetobacter baumannii]|nr:hypothetical protein [Acinetobacter baumannii]